RRGPGRSRRPGARELLCARAYSRLAACSSDHRPARARVVSGLAGVYGLDGRPVDVSLLRRLTEAVAHRGPDGEGCWTDGAIGLGHRIARTTPESRGEKQPLLDDRGALGLVLDGRGDNRPQLAAWQRAAAVRLT